MHSTYQRLMAKVNRLARRLQRSHKAQKADLIKYQNDPAGYCRDILKVTLTPDQERIARRVCEPPYKVLVRAGHNVGKSFLAAALISWWYDCFKPGIVLSTAPTERQVQKILWKELRLLRAKRGGFSGPSICQMQDSPDHYAMGFTSRDGDRFQGHHSPAVMIVFDEAVGVDPVFWEAMETMLGGGRYAFIAIYNPTDTSSFAYQAEQSGSFAIESLSALTHPNISAELVGLPPPFPSAIRLDRLRDMMNQWAVPVSAKEVLDLILQSRSQASKGKGGRGVGVKEVYNNTTSIQPSIGDDLKLTPPGIQLPDGIIEFDNKYWKLGPIAESRVAGIWPSQAINAVLTANMLNVLFGLDSNGQFKTNNPGRHNTIPPHWLIQIGCDPARYGDDDTVFHVRQGTASLHHESRNGWSTKATARRCRELAWEYGQRFPGGPKRIPILIDETGLGAGVVDDGQGYNFIGINAGEKANDPDYYANVRAELWFSIRNLANEGVVLDMTRILPDDLHELKRQLLMPTYKLNDKGVVVLEKKDETKLRLGRSPDDADAFLLAYYHHLPQPDSVLGNIE